MSAENAIGTGGVFVFCLLAVVVLGLLGCSGPEQTSDISTSSTDHLSPTQVPPYKQGVPRLFDMTESAGLRFAHQNGRTGALYMAETLGGGGALLDVDDDGDLDIYLVQGGSLDGQIDIGVTDRLWLNQTVLNQTNPDQTSTRAVRDRPPMRFIDGTERAGLEPRDPSSYGMGAAAGDVDNDGRSDLYITALGHNRLLRNRGDGILEDITISANADDPRWSVSAAFADLDGDGWLDLLIGNYVDFSVAGHRECRSENGALDYCGPSVYPAQANRILRNLGGEGEGDVRFKDVTADWGFGSAASGATLGILAVDIDNDGWLEIYEANDENANRLWQRGPSWPLHFEDRALSLGCAVNGEGQPEASMGIGAGDLDADGDADILVSHLRSETHTYYLNQGERGFADISLESGLGAPSRPSTGFGLALFDLDHDGWLDLYVANGSVRVNNEQARRGDDYPLHQRDQIFRNRTGEFIDFTAEAGPALEVSRVGRGVLVGDLDEDGDSDLVVVNNGGEAQLLENGASDERDWIGLNLVDPAYGGRQVLGAQISVEAANGRALWRRVDSGGGYASASDPRVLVGLGENAPETVSVEVIWPAEDLEKRRVEKWSALAIGRYHTLELGTGEAMR